MKTVDDEAVEQVTLEFGTSGHRTAGDSGRCRCEGELEEEKGVARNAEPGVDVRQVAEEEPLLAKNAVARAKHQAKADRPEANRAD